MTKVVRNDVKGGGIALWALKSGQNSRENYTTNFRTDAVLGKKYKWGYRIIVRIR